MTSKQDDQKERFLQLYNPCHVRLSRFISTMVWDKEEARDLMSDTVMQAWQGFEKLRDTQAFLAYLFSIAYRQVKRYRRRQQIRQWFSLTEAEHVPDTHAGADTLADMVFFKQAMDKLKAKEKETYVLFEIAGLSLKEIQDVQGDSLSAVKSRLVRARDKLQRMLNNEMYFSQNESPPGVQEPNTTKDKAILEEETNIIVLQHAASGK